MVEINKTNNCIILERITSMDDWNEVNCAIRDVAGKPPSGFKVGDVVRISVDLYTKCSDGGATNPFRVALPEGKAWRDLLARVE